MYIIHIQNHAICHAQIHTSFHFVNKHKFFVSYSTQISQYNDLVQIYRTENQLEVIDKTEKVRQS